MCDSEIDAFSFGMLRTILRKSGFIKWSFWKRTAKPLTPLKSTRFEVPIPYVTLALRLQKLAVMAKNCISAIIDLGPPFVHFCQHRNFAPFSFRMLRTTAGLLARPSASQGVGRCAPVAFLPVLLRPPGGAPHSKANNSNSRWLNK